VNDRVLKRSTIAQAISLILGTSVAVPAFAQEQIEEVVVTGIRGSLTSSMNLKRDAQGVLDGNASAAYPSTVLRLAKANASRSAAWARISTWCC
jgi:hypothetical protein